MSLTLTWSGIAIRLLCAVFVGALFGLNRTEQGRAAGLRTSILVTLAACVAMLQVNLLLPLAGRAPNSFVMNDLMRLPLGILSGMGFIGAGAIVRRDKLVIGVTTAATMWFLTVIGLCLGGGQVALGLIAATIGLLVLIGFKSIEARMKQVREGKLVIVAGPSGPEPEEVRRTLRENGFYISSFEFAAGQHADGGESSWELRWRAQRDENAIPEAIRKLGDRPGVIRTNWTLTVL